MKIKLIVWLAWLFWLAQFAAYPAVVAQDTVPVKRGDLILEVNIAGVFVADDKDELSIEPSEYRGNLIVTKIVPEGVAAKKGDILMEFDQGELDEAIEAAQNEATDAEVELNKAKAEHQTALIDLDAKQAQLQVELESLQLEIEAAISQQELDLADKQNGIEDAQQRVADLRIDLQTLKDIYQEREIEIGNSVSGKILIEREESRIANSEKDLLVREKEFAFFQKFEKSKTQLDKELELEKKRAELRKQKIVLEADVVEKQSLVQKAHRKWTGAQQKVDGLLQDREQLQIQSPRDGLLFYGTTGNELPAGVVVSGMPDSRRQLKIGGRINTHSVLLTVAAMDNLSIKMKVLEHDIQHLRKGLPVSIFPDAFPNTQFAGELTQVDQIATKIHFSTDDRRFTVVAKCTEPAPQMRSGMNCRVTVHPERMTDVLLVPIVAVQEKDGKYFCVVKDAGGTEQREVQLGLCNEDWVQITDGLDEGEQVVVGNAE